MNDSWREKVRQIDEAGQVFMAGMAGILVGILAVAAVVLVSFAILKWAWSIVFP